MLENKKNEKVIDYKWMFKKKEVTHDMLKSKHEVRLVAKRFTQMIAVGYNDIFSLVVKLAFIIV